jgi:hypothetical protein
VADYAIWTIGIQFQGWYYCRRPPKGVQMPKCIVCGSETPLLVHGQSLCLKCDDDREERNAKAKARPSDQPAPAKAHQAASN